MNGDTEIELNGRTVTLKCTPRAMRMLDQTVGSFAAVNDGLMAYRFGAYCSVVAAGLGKTPAQVEEDVYATGMLDLVGPLMVYVNRLMRGGREKEPDDKEKASGEA